MMVIHVVSQGETLSGIAAGYRVTLARLIEINGISSSHHIVVGETLLIPLDNVYYVQQGDSLTIIARKLSVSLEALQKANPALSGQPLQIGAPIQIPKSQPRKILTNGFIDPATPPSTLDNKAYPSLTYISLFSYHVTPEGSLVSPKADQWLEKLKQVKTKPLMTITNIKGGTFDRDLAAQILNSDRIQDRLFQNILKEIKAKGYRGVVVDFEYLGSGTKQKYSRFLRRLTNVLHKEGYLVMTAVAPKLSGQQTGAWYEAHDYGEHGKIVDYVILMTYEWGWSGGPPMPVSPLTQVEKVIQYAKSVMPSRKIIMSMPLYGYDWQLPFVQGGEFAKAISTPQAYTLAYRHHEEVQFDKKEAAPFFRYKDEAGKTHIVYFNDLRTASSLSSLVNRYQLGGISFWNLAFSYPVIWPFLRDRFEIRH